MEKNHICKKCGGIAGWDSYFQSWICTRCGNEDPKPTTKYDLLIRKTPEEMAEFIGSDPMFDICPHNCYNDPGRPCEVCVLEWLKQEAKNS